MAAVVRCECCGKVVPHTKAAHLRIYPMSSATTYSSGKCLDCADVCNDCHNVIKALLKQREDK